MLGFFDERINDGKWKKGDDGGREQKGKRVTEESEHTLQPNVWRAYLCGCVLTSLSVSFPIIFLSALFFSLFYSCSHCTARSLIKDPILLYYNPFLSIFLSFFLSGWFIVSGGQMSLAPFLSKPGTLFFFHPLMDKWNNDTGGVEAASLKFQAVPLEFVSLFSSVALFYIIFFDSCDFSWKSF